MRAGKYFGVEIRIHYSVVVVLLLNIPGSITFHMDLFEAPSLADFVFIPLLTGLLVLGSIVFHELAHALVARRLGLKVDVVELNFAGGASQLDEVPQGPKQEAKLAIVGPLASLFLAGTFNLLWIYLDVPPYLLTSLLYMAWVNQFVGIFNFLPIYPMDGYRVLRAYMWWKKGYDVADSRARKAVDFLVFGLLGLAYGNLLWNYTISVFWWFKSEVVWV